MIRCVEMPGGVIAQGEYEGVVVKTMAGTLERWEWVRDGERTYHGRMIEPYRKPTAETSRWNTQSSSPWGY